MMQSSASWPREAPRFSIVMPVLSVTVYADPGVRSIVASYVSMAAGWPLSGKKGLLDQLVVLFHTPPLALVQVELVCATAGEATTPTRTAQQTHKLSPRADATRFPTS